MHALRGIVNRMYDKCAYFWGTAVGIGTKQVNVASKNIDFISYRQNIISMLC